MGLGFRRRICDRINLLFWPLNSDSQLTLPGDGEGQTQDFKSGWGCSQARPLPWYVALSLTSSSLGCLPHGAVGKRTWDQVFGGEMPATEGAVMTIRALPVSRSNEAREQGPSTILASWFQSTGWPRADPALMCLHLLNSQTAFWEGKPAAHKIMSQTRSHVDFYSHPQSNHYHDCFGKEDTKAGTCETDLSQGDQAGEWWPWDPPTEFLAPRQGLFPQYLHCHHAFCTEPGGWQRQDLTFNRLAHLFLQLSWSVTRSSFYGWETGLEGGENEKNYH